MKFAVCQRRKQAFTTALQLQNVDIKAALQATVVQGNADQLRAAGDGYLGAVTTAVCGQPEFIAVPPSVRQKNPRGQNEIEGAGQPDRQADQGEAEQFKRAVAELLTDVADQQVHRASQQGEGSPKNRRERERQQHP